MQMSAALLAFALATQALEFHDVDNRPGVQIGYSRFTEQGILQTKRMSIDGATGKGSLLDPRAATRRVDVFLATFWQGKRPAKPVPGAFLVVDPEPKTFGGSIVRDAERQDGKAAFYFAPDARAILLADGVRVDLGTVEKPGGLDALGRYNGAAIISLPVAALLKLTHATKAELAVGPMTLSFPERTLKRFREFSAALADVQPSP